jgi:CubicO group peptidase (beta-lactamase class C family)
VTRFGSANAAATLYSTPGDIARFLAELMNPKILGVEQVKFYLSEHAAINERVSWGMGIGLEKHGDHHDFWHWGHMPDYQNFFCGCAREKWGVVIMTNSTNGLDAVPGIVEAATGKKQDPLWEKIPLIFIITKR